TVQPTTVDQKVAWSGGNDKASVSATGLITGLKPGAAKATVTSVTYSTYSTDVNVTVVDTKAPVWNGGTLSAGSVTNTTVVLNWPAAKDSVGVAQYKLLWNNSKEAIVEGNVQSYTVTGLLPGTAYSFQLTAIDAAGNISQALPATVRTYSSSGRGPSSGGGSGTSGGSGSTTTGGDNGTSGTPTTGSQIKLPADAMQVKTETRPDGTVSSKVTVDGAKLAEALKESAKQKSPIVVLDLNSSSASVNVVLPAQILFSAAAASPNAVILVNTSSASYELPLQAISKLASANSKDATLQVSISQANQQLEQLAANQAKQAGATLLQQPIEYHLAIAVNGKIEEVANNATYITKTMVLSKAVDPNKATGVIVNPITGQMRFVPTLFVTENGVTKAKWMHPGNDVYAIIESSKSFNDMKEHWAQKEVELLASKWLIQGSSLTTFEPNRSITRAEFASILVRALGLDEQLSGAAFSDVKADAWYAGSVGAAVSAGLVQGYETGQFQPEATITREQMAVMIERAAKFAGMSTTDSTNLSQAYSDAASISGWAEKSVSWAVKAGIMQGTGERSFAPGELATRAQAAVMLKRMLQQLKFIN
ncbi:S-layer homology domain-containing protein, partial [Paenibacillus sp. UNC451MF]|uniref:S-layer homology domain-containing protein n=1 Tax=Paenibacillus sp. UNC451MF TaxID=1449063 RepID=UPI00048AD3EA